MARQTLAALAGDRDVRVQPAMLANPSPDDLDRSTEQHQAWIAEFSETLERVFDALGPRPRSGDLPVVAPDADGGRVRARGAERSRTARSRRRSDAFETAVVAPLVIASRPSDDAGRATIQDLVRRRFTTSDDPVSG